MTPPSKTNIQSGTQKNSSEPVFRSSSKRSHVITVVAQAAGKTHSPADGEKAALYRFFEQCAETKKFFHPNSY